MYLKKSVLILLIIILVQNLSALEIGDNAISFKAKSINNKEINLDDFKGKKAVWLVFWATWCPNCKAEIPALKNLYEKYKNKLEIIGINVAFNDSIKKSKEYIKKYNIPYDIIFSSEISRQYGIIGTPTQIAIDINGKVVFIGVNIPKNLKEEDINKLIQKL